MHFFDEVSGFFAEIGLVAKRLSVDSVLDGHEVLVRHFRLFVLILLLLRTDEPPLFGNSLEIVFAGHCPVKYLESSYLITQMLVKYLVLDFAVYLLHFLRDSFNEWIGE